MLPYRIAYLIITIFSLICACSESSIEKILNKKFEIRIKLSISNNSCKIVVTGPCEIFDSEGKLLLKQNNLPESSVGIFSKGLLWQNKQINETSLLIISTNPEITIRVNQKNYRGSILLQKYKESLLVINIIDIEKYLASILPQVIDLEDPEQYISAMAIVLRTEIMVAKYKNFYERFDLEDIQDNYFYKGIAEENNSVKSIVAKTERCVLTCNDQLFQPFYHPCCGGATASAADVFGYPQILSLIGRPCPICQQSKESIWDKSFKITDLQYLFVEMNYASNQDVVNQKLGMIVKSRNQYGRVLDMNIICGKKILFIKALQLSQYKNWQIFKSTYFNIKIRNNEIYVIGKGMGHGVGLCQYAARHLAEKHTAREILKLYYIGSQIQRLVKEDE